jgi:hypothetical protein
MNRAGGGVSGADEKKTVAFEKRVNHEQLVLALWWEKQSKTRLQCHQNDNAELK